jgi:hypothetical protein
MDQNLLSCLDLGIFDNRLPSRQSAVRYTGSFLKRQMSRFGLDIARAGKGILGVTASENSIYCLSRLEGGDVFADGFDDACTLDSRSIWQRYGDILF